MLQPTNMTAVLLAAVAAWIFGAIYYSLLGKAWLAAQGETSESMRAKKAGKSGIARIAPFIISFAAEIVMAAALQGILFHSAMDTMRQGIIAGALTWLGFITTTVAVNNAYPGRRFMLTVIDAGHWLGVMLIIGAVIGGRSL
jgi:cytochrome bd-type quinol oxidase subunit 2